MPALIAGAGKVIDITGDSEICPEDNEEEWGSGLTSFIQEFKRRAMADNEGAREETAEGMTLSK